KKINDDDEFYSALLLIFSNAFSKIKNKPTPIPLPKNDNNTNTTTNSYTITNILPTKTTAISSTTSTSTTLTPKPTKPDFNLPNRPKNLPEPKTSNTTTSTTTTIPSTTSSSPTTTFTKTTSKPLEPTSDNNISCPIYKINLKQTEIEKHLRQHIRNLLLKDFIYFQIRELIEILQKYIEKYGEQFIDFISDDMKQEILYNFDKIMLGV
ncbi:9895_t:CDS:2, partial [Gigaspora margarita]